MTRKPLKRKNLKAVIRWLTRPHSTLEPVTALLECGHHVKTNQKTKSAHCSECVQPRGIPAARRRFHRVKREGSIDYALAGVYCRAVGEAPKRVVFGKADAVRVVRVRVEMGVKGGRAVRIARDVEIVCERMEAVDWVRAELARALGEMDGTVLKVETA